jgi:hypothetical protein
MDGRPNLERRRPDRAALVIAAGLLVAAGVIFADTASMGTAASYARVGPKVFPYVVAAGLALLAVGTAVKAWRGGFPERERDELPPILWIVGGLLAQMLLLTLAGFSIATGLLFAATARGFGRGPLWMTVPIGIVLSFVIWLIFARVLQLSLPAGPIERLFL